MVALRKLLEVARLAVTARRMTSPFFQPPLNPKSYWKYGSWLLSTRQQWPWEGWWQFWIDHRASSICGPWCIQHPPASYWEPVRPILHYILFYSLIIFYKFLQYAHLCPVLASEDANRNILPSWPWKETPHPVRTGDHAYFSRNFFFCGGEGSYVQIIVYC